MDDFYKNAQDMYDSIKKAQVIDDLIKKTQEELMSQYTKELLEVCLTFDVNEVKKLVSKWSKRGLFPHCFDLPSDDVLEISIRKIVIARTDAPKEAKKEAAAWLIDHDCDLSIY